MTPARRHDTAVRAGGAEVPLVDLLDRLLDRGVAISGDVLLSVADVDLVSLGLRAVLKGVEGAPLPPVPPATLSEPAATAASTAPVVADRATDRPHRSPVEPPAVPARTTSTSDGDRRRQMDDRPARLRIDHDDVDRGLARLVLTVVELLRQVMERQALRRVDDETLTDAQVERLGVAFLRLHERMEDLKAQFGLSDDDVRLRMAVADVA